MTAKTAALHHQAGNTYQSSCDKPLHGSFFALDVGGVSSSNHEAGAYAYRVNDQIPDDAKRRGIEMQRESVVNSSKQRRNGGRYEYGAPQPRGNSIPRPQDSGE